MPQSNVSTWLKFATQQIAAESYLDGPGTLEEILAQGNNRANFPILNYTRLTQSQAQSFVQQYDIVNHHANDAIGFSATLTQERGTNNFTLSFRSTEYRNTSEGGDYERDGQPGADGEIFFKGFAFGQLVSMEKYYQKLKADGLLPSGAALTVTGYSLGGHLATVFTEMHESEITHTYSFNGAGRGQISGGTPSLSDGARIAEMVEFFSDQLLGNGLDNNPFASGATGNLYTDSRYQAALQAVFDRYQVTSRALSDIPRTDGPFAKLTQLVGHATHGDTELVANSGVHRAETSVFIEDQPDIDGFGGFFGHSGDFGTTHSIILLMDSLALTELIQTITPALSRDVIERMFAASSSERASGLVGSNGIAEANSLENALDAIRKVFAIGSDDPVTDSNPATGGFGNIDNRNQFYDHLNQVKSLVASGLFSIDSLTDMSPSSISSQARSNSSDGMAYRYALQELIPFAVRGVDYGALHNQGPADTRSLDLYDAQTGHGTWTALALIDRAELLSKRLAYNRSDGGAVPTDTHYLDLQSGFEVGSTSSTNEVIFGDERVGDVIIGHSGDDHLYGRDGADTIEGNGGRDYIEGGVGNDPRLSGGVGDDIILGQQGNDQLYGEADNDQLNGGLGDDLLDGGKGLDTYFYRTGQGLDRIADADKVGAIIFDNQTLVGGIRRQGAPADTYLSRDGQFTFVKSGANLVINTTLTIENFDFQTGALGINLTDAGNLADSAGPEIDYNNGQRTLRYDGDATANHPTFTAAANHDVYGYGGNDVLNLSTSSALFNHQLFGGDDDDELSGGAGQDRLFGDDGLDVLFGGAGDDVLDGGTGDDLLNGGVGQDVLVGGLDNDSLRGDSGDDVLVGGKGDDLMFGDDRQLDPTRPVGKDYLDGGAGADWLFGGLGNDVLVGGTEEDHLYGDNVPASSGPSIIHFSTTGGADYLDGGAGADYLQGDAGDDVLLGGADNDELVGDDLQVGVMQEGADWLDGEGGNDVLIGGGGEDTLFGGDDDDLLSGDYANNAVLGFGDTLSGGAGADEWQLERMAA